MKATVKEKREHLAMLEAQIKVAIEQPGIAFHNLKAQAEALREDIMADEQSGIDEDGCAEYTRRFAPV